MRQDTETTAQTKADRPTWRLDLTERQFRCIMRGMEVYSRIICGQLSELRQCTPHFTLHDEDIADIKHAMFPELGLNESYGWNGGIYARYKESGDTGLAQGDSEGAIRWHDTEIAQGYQIYHEMRHADVIDRGVSNVYTSPTLPTAKAAPPIVTRIYDSYNQNNNQNNN